MLAAQGVPDGAGVWSTVWKLLLGFLPNDRSLWEQELAEKRSQYAAFKDEFLVSPVGGNSKSARRVESEGHHNENAQHVDNVLLHRSEYSEIMEQIDRDIKRTHPDMHFFCGDSSAAKSNQESLKNVLLIFAKLNAGIRYVQGMNEILAPLLVAFRSDPDDKNAGIFAEADSFFCSIELLSGFRDNFCRKLNNSAIGIRGTLQIITTSSEVRRRASAPFGNNYRSIYILQSATLHAVSRMFLCSVSPSTQLVFVLT
ncbi:uncharacterized protein LOC133910202 [Phragmites australis]|uniref:uncharacterized protein LOC133910202 n=1 Tax=Phragmites australis TaxID=29695 RepID=UPI002D76A1F8|nr:uncharacterized protein LOC133910202 [Phragmites australis]